MTYIIICLSSLASLVLAYYGYLFANIYYSKKYKRKNNLIVLLFTIFLFPFSYVVLIVLGFLYGSGPLRKYLENCYNVDNEKK